MSPAAPSSYTCPATGLRIIHAGLSGYRIATREWGPLNPRPRYAAPGATRSDWSRYDVPGTTIYLAETEQIAFAEMLAPYARLLGSNDSLRKDAHSLGMTIEDFIAEVSREWDEQAFMQQGHLPGSWRTRRLLYRAETRTSGPWVDIEHPDSIAAIRHHLGHTLHRDAALTTLTVANLRSDNREVTTRIASWVNHQVLNDGTTPWGIVFGSKHGGGQCFAYWPRANDPAEKIEITARTLIAADDHAPSQSGSASPSGD